MSITEMLLEAAGCLPREFSVADLAVAAHGKFPRHFCLEGYAGIPDSKKVSAAICHQSGLVKRGLLIRTGPNRLSLPSQPRTGNKEAPSPPSNGLPPGIELPTRLEMELWRAGRQTMALIMHRQRMCAIGRGITIPESKALFEREEDE